MRPAGATALSSLPPDWLPLHAARCLANASNSGRPAAAYHAEHPCPAWLPGHKHKGIQPC